MASTSKSTELKPVIDCDHDIHNVDFDDIDPDIWDGFDDHELDNASFPHNHDAQDVEFDPTIWDGIIDYELDSLSQLQAEGLQLIDLKFENRKHFLFQLLHCMTQLVL